MTHSQNSWQSSSPSGNRTATLTGSRKNPELLLRFGPRTPISSSIKLPKYEPVVRRGGKQGHNSRPKDLQEWVKQLPGRTWDNEEKAWKVFNPGPDIESVLTALGFEIDLGKAVAAGFTSLNDFMSPIFEVNPDNQWETMIYPRFSMAAAGLPGGSYFDKSKKCWIVHTPDLPHMHDTYPVPASLLALGDTLVDSLAEPLKADPGESPKWPSIFGLLPRGPKRLPQGLPCAQPWAGINLYGYQVAGMYSMLGGHTMLADAPGLGKTYSSIAAHATVETKRLVVISPPVALTNWQKEISKYASAYPVLAKGKIGAKQLEAESEEGIVRREGAGVSALIVAGRKVPEFPESGAIIVPDSLLRSRPELLAQVKAWNADGLIVDESHRFKTWDSERSRAVRNVAQDITGLRIAISGTPMLASPVELASQLAITGHLDTIFGGLHKFLDKYAYQDFFGKWIGRKKELSNLRAMMDAFVWVRRVPEQVYNIDPNGPTMPDVMPPRAAFVDVDLKGYRDAMEKQYEVIDEWLDENPRPTLEDVNGFLAGSIGFISPLRKAAGLAKISVAIERIEQWIESDPERHNPLLVWVHHTEVAEAMSAAVEAMGAPVAVIDGSTSSVARGRITQEFQAGKYAAIVLSLQAAGVAITLTRGCDNLFVESDWTPATLTQARDRTRRIGQTRSVTLTTMVATGTLDEHIQRVQANKAQDLDIVLGSGNDTSVVKEADQDLATPRTIVWEMLMTRMAKRGVSTSHLEEA